MAKQSLVAKDAAKEHPGAVSPKLLHVLEYLDNMAHVVVAGLFILMAATVLIYTGIVFTRQFAAFGNGLHPEVHTTTESASGSLKSPEAKVAEQNPANIGKEKLPDNPIEAAEHQVDDRFYRNSLQLLSSILFAVVVLELLRTIITYLQSRDIQAIMKEFLVVGIISSIRKILLVGAESSLSTGERSGGMEFIREAGGTVISIIGILLLIYGLVYLQQNYTPNKEETDNGDALGKAE